MIILNVIIVIIFDHYLIILVSFMITMITFRMDM